MHRHTAIVVVCTAAAVSVSIFLGCGDDATPCSQTLGDGTCIGVASGPICDEAYCTAGATCAKTFYVLAGAKGSGTQSSPLGQISAAASLAVSGDCIAVAAGSYTGGIKLAGGVSLLGAGADRVKVVSSAAGQPGLVVQGGKGGTLRGFSIAGDGRGLSLSKATGVVVRQIRLESLRELALEVASGSGVVIESSEVTDTRGNSAGQWGVGVQITGGSTVKLTHSLISGSKLQGVLVNESGLELRSSRVGKNGAYGVSIECLKDSQCKTGLASLIENTTLSANAAVGLLVAGAKVTAKDLDVTGTTSAAAEARGVEVQGTSEFTMTGSTVMANQGLGLLLDGEATARQLQVSISGCTVEGNDDRGIMVQTQDQGSISLDNNTVTNNRFAGIVVNDATGVSIKGGRVAKTRNKTVKTTMSAATCGDGIQVINGSKSTISAVTLEHNERLGALFDSADGAMTGCQLSGNKTAFVVQNGASGTNINNNTDDAGAPVKQTPVTKPLELSNDLISNSPVPQPPP